MCLRFWWIPYENVIEMMNWSYGKAILFILEENFVDSLKILFSSSTNNRQNDCMIRMNTEVSMKIKIHDFKNVKMWAVSKAVQIMKLKCIFF